MCSLLFVVQVSNVFAEAIVIPIDSITIIPNPVNEKATEIVFLLDRSGSMSGLESDTIGGFNGFVKEQSKMGKTYLTTVLFDDKYEILHNNVNAKNAVLTKEDYYTRGSTALLDAVGKTIQTVKRRLENENRKVIFVITTDGQENASKEYTYAQIKRMISTQQEEYNWEFVFMGANIDAMQEGTRLSIKPTNTFNYSATSDGTKAMFAQANESVLNIRNADFLIK